MILLSCMTADPGWQRLPAAESVWPVYRQVELHGSTFLSLWWPELHYNLTLLSSAEHCCSCVSQESIVWTISPFNSDLSPGQHSCEDVSSGAASSESYRRGFVSSSSRTTLSTSQAEEDWSCGEETSQRCGDQQTKRGQCYRSQSNTKVGEKYFMAAGTLVSLSVTNKESKYFFLGSTWSNDICSP